jgi:hypothetical protein
MILLLYSSFQLETKDLTRDDKLPWPYFLQRQENGCHLYVHRLRRSCEEQRMMKRGKLFNELVVGSYPVTDIS